MINKYSSKKNISLLKTYETESNLNLQCLLIAPQFYNDKKNACFSNEKLPIWTRCWANASRHFEFLKLVLQLYISVNVVE
jgi:hypothetical protein